MRQLQMDVEQGESTRDDLTKEIMGLTQEKMKGDNLNEELQARVEELQQQ